MADTAHGPAARYRVSKGHSWIARPYLMAGRTRCPGRREKWRFLMLWGCS